MVRRRTPAACALAVCAALLAAGCGGDGGKAPAAAPPSVRSTPSARPIVLVVDGKRTETTTTAATVKDVLAQAGIDLGRYYIVKPSMDSPADDKIKVVRLLSAPVTKKVRIEPKTVTKKNSKLAAWSEKVLRKGRPGLKEVQTAYVRHKGKKVKRVVATTIRRKPRAQIVAVGPQPSSVGGAADRLNWAGLAKCESGGRPNAVNSAGYYGLYQFSLQTWGTVGGSGLPSNASAAEQTYRAKLLYNRVSGRWQGQWPNCGRFLFS